MNIIGYKLDENKIINYELKKIYGIGIKTANKISKKIKIDKKKIFELKKKEIEKIKNELKKYKIDIELKKDKLKNIEKLIKIKSYRGIRHKKKLPVRGQRTRTNAKTNKKKNTLYNKS